MTERELELRGKIKILAIKGKAAAQSGNTERSAELILQLQPLMRELAALTQDKGWNELADEGTEIYNSRPQAERHWEQRR